MADRSYEGAPIDASFKKPPWQRDGETIDVVDSNHSGSESSENSTDLFEGGQLKTNVDAGSDLANDIIRASMSNPSASVREVAQRAGCDPTYAWRVIKRKSAFEKYQRDALDQLSEKASKIVQLRASQPERTQASIADQVGVSEAYVSNVLRGNDQLVNELRGDA